MIDRAKIKELIQQKFSDQYQAGLEETIDDVIAMNADVQRRTMKFLETGEIEEAEIEGYTIDQLSRLGMNTLAAFLMQDWLLRNPEEAKKAIKRGHDSVGSRGK